jgi:hypothetical protein
MLHVFSVAWLALSPSAPPVPAAPAPSAGATTVIPFRTAAQPRVDPVFGDAAALRQAVDRFFSLQGEMERTRDDFSTAVHETLAALAGAGVAASGNRPAAPPKACPVATAAPYGRALTAGTHYLSLGQELQTRYRDIRRADDLGDAAALTPDYRAKVKKARDLHQRLLDDYREMRVAFYDQLGAEMRYASCKTGPKAVPAVTGGDAAGPNPMDASAWTLDDFVLPDEMPVPAPAPKPTAPRAPAAPQSAAAGTTAMAAPAIWIDVDNTLCAQPTRISVDGQPLGEIGARKKTSVRTHAGPREICALPASDSRACGDAGTVRKAYLHEGWSLTVHCN